MATTIKVKDKEVAWNEDLIQVGEEVYILRWCKNPDYVDDYNYRVKTSAGQHVCMGIHTFEGYTKKYQCWCVVLDVKDKKRDKYGYGKQTGRSGLTPLLIAKEILKWHIEKIIKSRMRCCDGQEHLICIFWDNTAREKAYERGLRDLGFHFVNSPYKALVKVISKQSK